MTRRLKLLLVLWNSPYMMGGYYARALREVADVHTAGPSFEGARSDFDLGPGDPLAPVLERLGKVDFLVQFYSKPDYFPPDLHLLDVPKAWYVYDTHLHMDVLASTAYLFDAVFCCDEAARRGFRARGIPVAGVLEFAADPAFYLRPLDGGPEPIYDAGFAGSVRGHPSLAGREAFLAGLGRECRLEVRHRSLVGAAAADFYRQCRVVVNHAVADDVNMRVPEALLAGRPLLTPAVSGLNDYLTPGEHAVVYRDEAHARDLMRGLLADPAGARAMAARGQAHALARHTYALRARAMVDILARELARIGREGRPARHPWLAQAAQFRYHYFRFPGDALRWLDAPERAALAGIAGAERDNLPGRLLGLGRRLLTALLGAYARLRGRAYFQRKA